MQDVKACPLCRNGIMNSVANIQNKFLYQCDDCAMLFMDYVAGNPLKKGTATKEKDQEYLGIVHKAVSGIEMKTADKVLDVYSRDGELLGWYATRYLTVGVEPDASLNAIALKTKRANISLPSQFDSKIVDELKKFEITKFKVITVIDVLQDEYDPRAFISLCKDLLDTEGVLVIQVPYIPQIINEMKEDGVQKFVYCQNYFLIFTLKHLLNDLGLTAQGAEIINNSIRVYATYPSYTKFYRDDQGERLRLYLGITSGIVTVEVSGRYDQASTYKKLEAFFNDDTQIKRGDYQSPPV